MLDIEDIRDILTVATNKLYNSENQDFYREEVAKFRQLKKETLEDIRAFYIEDPYKDLLPVVGEEIFYNPVYGFYPKDTMYKERFIFPVWSIDKKVIGFVGYDNLSTFRYILSETEGFKKKTSLYGMQNLDRAYKEGYIIIVEGHMDERRLYELGYPVIALQGTAFPPFLKYIFKSLKGVIYMLDSDKAGRSALKYNRNLHKNQVTINLPGEEDPDSYLRSIEHQKAFKKALLEIDKYNFLIPQIDLPRLVEKQNYLLEEN